MSKLRLDNTEKFDLDILIELVRKRTSMYTVGDSLQYLNSFISGAETVLLKLEIQPQSIFHNNFNDWLQEKYKFGSSVIGWANTITALALDYKNSTEIRDWDEFNRNLTFEDNKKARELFFKLFDEFKEIKN